MEPLILDRGSRHRAELTDLALELAQRSAGFRRSLPPSLLTSLPTLVRVMNCYYSDMIEGHDTHRLPCEALHLHVRRASLPVKESTTTRSQQILGRRAATPWLQPFPPCPCQCNPRR
jgi:hypothetical protein